MRGGTFVVACIALSSCGPRYGPEDNPTMLLDASGTPFGWSCDDVGCDLRPTAGTPLLSDCNGDATPFWGLFWGRFVRICSACAFADGSGWGAGSGDCRIVGCSGDVDCPAIYEADPEAHYVCVNGLCQNDDVARFPRDAPLDRFALADLCYAEVPRDETVSPLDPRSMEIEASITAACPPRPETGPCTLPVGCRAP